MERRKSARISWETPAILPPAPSSHPPPTPLRPSHPPPLGKMTLTCMYYPTPNGGALIDRPDPGLPILSSPLLLLSSPLPVRPDPARTPARSHTPRPRLVPRPHHALGVPPFVQNAAQ